MAELLGTHSYQLDPKGRVSLPARFRETFAYFRRLDPAFEERVNSFVAEHVALERSSVRLSLEEYAQPTARALVDPTKPEQYASSVICAAAACASSAQP